MFFGNGNFLQNKNDQFLKEDQNIGRNDEIYNESDIFLPDFKVSASEKNNNQDRNHKPNVENRKIQNNFENKGVDIEKLINEKFSELENKLLKVISGTKEYSPYFINAMFSSKGDYCNVTFNFMEMNIGILSDYDEEPFIFPFGNHNLPNFSSGKSVNLIYENFDGEKGIITGHFDNFGNKNVIRLPNNYAKIIVSFPCTIKYCGRI